MINIPEVANIRLADYPQLLKAVGERIEKINAERTIPFKTFKDYMIHLMIKDCRL